MLLHYMASLVQRRHQRGLAGFGYIFQRDSEHAATIHKAFHAASNSCRKTPIKRNLPDPSVQLAAAEDPAGCFFILENCFALAIGDLLDIDPEQLDYNQPVANLGIHSLVAIRIRE
ncbi:unnamed protein product [Penicillium camemberti]|uniref:Str. FM013 n=1 Tax=Penicillium camemberti (strain FM 013) TaxID=1429867 RepID=A0A0G4PNM8_PENC3|nr:unnamed protein product [Penicillium camemberti]